MIKWNGPCLTVSFTASVLQKSPSRREPSLPLPELRFRNHASFPSTAHHDDRQMRLWLSDRHATHVSGENKGVHSPHRRKTAEASLDQSNEAACSHAKP